MLVKTFQYFQLNLLHKWYVAVSLFKIAFRLMGRAIVHDWSKFTLTEMKHVIPHLPGPGVGFQDLAYQEYLAKAQVAIDHHLKHNSHHPHHFPETYISTDPPQRLGGYRDMSMLDLIEMVVDWRASARRKIGGGNLQQSFVYCQQLYQIDEQTMKFLKTLAPLL